MPINDLPQRMRELGRLRMGEKAISKNGKPYPVKRNTWRFTSQSFALLDTLAGQYGGEVEPWPEAPGEGEQWQLKTNAGSIDVLIPAKHSLSQWYEFWTADGCTRRCTGTVNVIDESKCVCPVDISARMDAAAGVKPTACKPTTRLNVMLPNTPDLGYWRLEAHGYQAAIELPGTVAKYIGLVKMASGADFDDDSLFHAELSIEERSSKKPGQPVSHYVVPVIRTPQVTPAMLMSGESPALGSGVTQIEAPAEPPPRALEAGSKREAQIPAPSAPPSYEPFTDADVTIIDHITAGDAKAAALAAGLTTAQISKIVDEATGGDTNIITKVAKSQWAGVEAALLAASKVPA